MAFVIADRVKETSTSTGTGAMTLAGAMTGFRTFSSKCSVGDTCYYAIQAVDASGLVTGEWECGLGTYSAANTLTRTLVTASSNADAAVSFAAGIKHVYITVPATQAAWPRERLTSGRTYYVATTGSDSNDGLSSGTPFLTLQKAIDIISGTLDLSTYAVTVQLADGTYTVGANLKPCVGQGVVTIQGNTTTPSNTIISTTSASCINGSNCGSSYKVQYLMLQTTTSGSGVSVSGTSVLALGAGLVFGACATAHLSATKNAVINGSAAAYTIAGASPVHVQAIYGAVIDLWGGTTTLSAAHAFSAAFAYMAGGAILFIAARTFSGSATGVKYNISGCSILDTQGGGASFLPGDTAGSATAGAQYV